MINTFDPDALIVGGGVVGLGVALEITRRFPHLRLLLLEKEDRVVVRYIDNSNGHDAYNPNGHGVYNPNGSLRDIAGICNERRNVMGLMPHPEDAVEAAASMPLQERVKELMKSKSLRKMDALKAAAKERGISKRQAYEELENS